MLALFLAACAAINVSREASLVSGCDSASVLGTGLELLESAICFAGAGPGSSRVLRFAASVAVAQKLTGIVEDVEWPQPKNIYRR